jgi:hypothetical protein
MLNGGKRLLRKLLHIWLVALVRIFLEELDGGLVAIHLLLGISFVKVRRGCAVQVVD